MIDFQPSDEQQLVIDTVRQFATNEIRPKARECDESKKLPEKVIEQAHELGLVANALPESAGGGGERSAVTGVLVAEELAVGDLAIALAILSPGPVGAADRRIRDRRTETAPRALRRCTLRAGLPRLGRAALRLRSVPPAHDGAPRRRRLRDRRRQVLRALDRRRRAGARRRVGRRHAPGVPRAARCRRPQRRTRAQHGRARACRPQNCDSPVYAFLRRPDSAATRAPICAAC